MASLWPMLFAGLDCAAFEPGHVLFGVESVVDLAIPSDEDRTAMTQGHNLSRHQRWAGGVSNGALGRRRWS